MEKERTIVYLLFNNDIINNLKEIYGFDILFNIFPQQFHDMVLVGDEHKFNLDLCKQFDSNYVKCSVLTNDILQAAVAAQLGNVHRNWEIKFVK